MKGTRKCRFFVKRRRKKLLALQGEAFETGNRLKRTKVFARFFQKALLTFSYLMVPRPLPVLWLAAAMAA
jgi:hypothetical protein